MSFFIGLIKLIGAAAFLLVLARHLLAPYRYYGFHPFVEALLYRLDRLCFPVERRLHELRLGWIPGGSLWVFGLGIALIRGVIYALLPANFTVYRSLGPIQTSFEEMVSLVLSLQLFACLLATIMLRDSVWTYRSVELGIIDSAAGSIFKRVGRIVGYRSKWTLLLASALFLAAIEAFVWILLALNVNPIVPLIKGLQLLNQVAYSYAILLIVYILSSWLDAGGGMRESAGYRIIAACAEPYLQPFRRWLGFLRWQNIDFSTAVGVGLLFMVVVTADTWLLKAELM